MNSERNHLDLRLISPKKDQKFSPNLLAYLKDQKTTAAYCHVYIHQGEKSLWIGYIQDGDFIGDKLMHVLCNGRKAQPACYSKASFIASLSRMPEFWAEYQRIGRCAIDLDHREHFMNAELRFEMATDGQTRCCRWCGVQQKKETWVELVPRERWVITARSN